MLNLNLRGSEPDQSTNEEAPLTVPGLDTNETEKARRELISACQNVAFLIDWLKNSIGLKHHPCFLVQAASTSAYNLINELAEPGVPEIFESMIVALSAGSQRWPIARGILRMLWVTLQQRKLDSLLTQSAIDLLKLSVVYNWGPEDHLIFQSSVYPNYAVVGEDGRDLADMGELLEKWAQMQLP